MDLFQNKYRIPSARLPFWNYGNAAAYFITICTQNREHFFGEIINGGSQDNDPVQTRCIASLNHIQSLDDNEKTPCMASLRNNHPIMQLSPLGKIVEQEWIKTPSLRPDMNLQLDEFIIMPNHFHAIIIIGDNAYNCTDAMHGVSNISTDGGNINRTDAMHRVSTGGDGDMGNMGNKFGPQSKNLASIIRGFKSAVTAQARKMGDFSFAWQPRFHDHIIRNDESFERIQQYIRNNPLNWKEDKFFNR